MSTEVIAQNCVFITWRSCEVRTVDQHRENFETWREVQGRLERDHLGNYHDLFIEARWRGYLACARENELVKS